MLLRLGSYISSMFPGLIRLMGLWRYSTAEGKKAKHFQVILSSCVQLNLLLIDPICFF